MEPKRELSSVDLAALATELSRYEGAKLDKAYIYDEDLLRLKLRDFDRGRIELLIEVGEYKQAHVADPKRVPDAPGRPPEFAMMLRGRIESADLVSVEQYEFDRILVFEFERPDQNTTLVVELFGDGNVAVLDENGEVVRSMETVRLKSRTVAPGSQYEFPQSRLNPLEVDYDTLEARMEQSDTDVVRTIATQLNLGGFWGEELCQRAGIEKAMAIDDAGEAEYRAIHRELESLSEALKSGQFDPRIYVEPDSDEATEEESDQPLTAREKVVDVSPVALEERADLPSRAFDSFNPALEEYFYRLKEQQRREEEGAGRERPDFEAEIEKEKRIIEQQEQAIEGFEEEAEHLRRKAELCYERYDLIDEMLSTIQEAREAGTSWADIQETLEAGAEQGVPAAEAVVDIDGAEGTVTVDVDNERITLHALTGVEKNADRLYREAKRVEGKKEGAHEAIEDTRERLEAVKQRREAWEEEPEPEPEPEEGEHEEIDWLARENIPVRQPEHWYEEFRWFRTSDGYLVIGGRNADQNEDLVKKYLDKHDRFFHTQAHGGPVTILKASAPSEPSSPVDWPDSSLEEAAQFAVAYSSVWKDGRGAGDAYMVEPDQVSKTPESGEYLEKGGFAIRGDREYFRDMACRVAVGITCEDETRVIGGPPSAIVPKAETTITLEPGKFAQNDAAVKCYREFKSRFADESFVRKIASADKIQEFLPPGGSDLQGV
ncbi:ribosome rescue protein RqcH [Halolamina salifodinae]|uniref:Archaeal Rqc2 homolog aRqcH n=1 Tax=Halolamina salifodinae TaxID=1202767 RepID=A0A8T4GZK9_9EURY|nr:ribosome rescue protein RqcH [Halolamina salifodinae]MBP1987563.1 putative ribosome quality control (RQC) complex YloA/Tae2 family protein [Halolamina salifodinae]